MSTTLDITEEQLEQLVRPLTAAHIAELCELRAGAKAAAEMFTTAISEQAEKAGIGKGALRRYICAREAEKIEELASEKDDIESLLEESV